MSKRKIESNPFGLFSHADEKPLEENLFHLLGLYDILVSEAIKQVPEAEKKTEFEQHYKLINDQRRAYREHHPEPKPEERKFLDLEEGRRFIVRASNYYLGQYAPVWFLEWLDDLYVKLGEDWRTIPLDELATLSMLEENGLFMAQPLAMNTIYKMLDRLGRDTTGIIGY